MVRHTVWVLMALASWREWPSTGRVPQVAKHNQNPKVLSLDFNIYCVHVYTCVCVHVCAKVKGQLFGIGSLLPLSGFWGSNLSGQG